MLRVADETYHTNRDLYHYTNALGENSSSLKSATSRSQKLMAADGTCHGI
jgi:hypothetical protein